MTTCMDVCYVELGYPPLKALVTGSQRKLFQRLWGERRGMSDDLWAHTVRLTLDNTRTGEQVNFFFFFYGYCPLRPRVSETACSASARRWRGEVFIVAPLTRPMLKTCTHHDCYLLVTCYLLWFIQGSALHSDGAFSRASLVYNQQR